MLKIITKNTATYVKYVIKNRVNKLDFFVVFWGLGPKVPQGGPRDSPGTPEGQELSKFVQK